MSKKTKKRITVALVVILALAVICAGAMIYANIMLNKINKIDNSQIEMVPKEEETFEVDDSLTEEGAGEVTMNPEDIVWNGEIITVMRDDDVKNILLIGQDKRSEEEGRQRSDTIIICSINTKTDKIILTSIMRDLYVPIYGYSDNRINAAYQFGGMPLLDLVIEDSLGIHIDGNVEVDFDGFIGALTQVGNLDIELTAAEAKYLSGGKGTLKEGMNSLTPEQALSYARLRAVGNSDWERTERQRRVVMAAFNKVRSSSLKTLMNLANEVLPYLTTDMTNSELLGCVYTVVTNGITEIESNRIPVEGTYTCETLRKGMEVLVPDLYENSCYLQEYIYGTSERK